MRNPDKNGLNLTFASNFPKGTLCKRPNHPRPSTYNPCTPRHLAFWSWTPTRLQSHGCLLASLLLPTSLCYPGMSDAKTQHQLPTPYPETSFGIAVRHSGEPMVARIRVLPVPSSTPFLAGRLPTLAWKGRPGLASFYPLSHPGTAGLETNLRLPWDGGSGILSPDDQSLSAESPALTQECDSGFAGSSG